MKKLCTDCVHFKESKCTHKSKKAKNGYFNCPIFKSIPIDVLTKEYKTLLVSKENPERLAFLKDKLESINGGTI